MGRPRRQSAGRSAARTRPGGSGGASRGGSGGISITNVSPVGNISGTSPMVRATVKDGQITLSPSDINVYLDGGAVERFQYRRTTGILGFSTGKLSSGAHTVEVVVSARGTRNARKSWSFVVK